MNRKQRRKLELSRHDDPPCAELRDDDGVLARDLFEDEQKQKTRNRRKDRQLCKQVFQTLSLELACLQHLPWARDVYVHAVEPAPDASRLRVAVWFYTPVAPEEAAEALGRLQAMTTRLRMVVGESICRKRVPELEFDFALE